MLLGVHKQATALSQRSSQNSYTVELLHNWRATEEDLLQPGLEGKKRVGFWRNGTTQGFAGPNITTTSMKHAATSPAVAYILGGLNFYPIGNEQLELIR